MITKGNRNKCYYCAQEETCTKDHFIPKSKNGKITVYACRICQFSKKDMMPLQWLKYIKEHKAINDASKYRINAAVTSLWILLYPESHLSELTI